MTNEPINGTSVILAREKSPISAKEGFRNVARRADIHTPLYTNAWLLNFQTAAQDQNGILAIISFALQMVEPFILIMFTVRR